MGSFEILDYITTQSMLERRASSVTYLQHKIREEIAEEDLVLVGSSGLVIYDQDGTRGKLLVSFFVTLCRGVKTFCPLKLTSVNITPGSPQLLQSFGLKHTCLKRYVLSPHFAEAAFPVLLTKKC